MRAAISGSSGGCGDTRSRCRSGAWRNAVRLKGVARRGAGKVRKRPGKPARGLAHVDMSYARVGVMTVPVRLPRRKKTAPPDSGDLLAWYDRNARVLPWRARWGERPEPYCVWLSEIMLQQTTVKAVAPYYARFVLRWPTVEALANADRDDVLRASAALGYYPRARNLHACARAGVERYDVEFSPRAGSGRRLPWR